MKLHGVTLHKKMILEYNIVLYRSSIILVFYEAKIEFYRFLYEAEADLTSVLYEAHLKHRFLRS